MSGQHPADISWAFLKKASDSSEVLVVPYGENVEKFLPAALGLGARTLAASKLGVGGIGSILSNLFGFPFKIANIGGSLTNQFGGENTAAAEADAEAAEFQRQQEAAQAARAQANTTSSAGSVSSYQGG